MTEIGRGEFRFVADDAEIDRALGRMSRKVSVEGSKMEQSLTKHLRTGGRSGGGSFSKEVERSVGGLRSRIKGTLTNIGQGLGQGIGQSITASTLGALRGLGGAIISTKNIEELDAASRKAATLTRDVDGLKKASFGLADELGNTLTATEALNSSYDVLSAGFNDTADVMEILKAAQKGAVGGFSDINTVANATTSVLNAYGLSAKDAGKLVDQFAGTQNAGKITIDEYSQNIGKLASTASGAGIAIEEVNAIIAASTAKGVRVSSAFDGIRAAISSTLKPSKDAADLASELGIEFNAAALRSKGIVGILKDLEKAGASSPETLIRLFGSVEAVAAIAPIAGEGLKDYAKALDIVKNTSADEAFNKVAGGLEQQKNAFKNILVDLDTSLKSGSFGQAIGSGLGLVNNALRQSIDWFKALSPETKSFIGAAAALSAGLTVLSAVAAATALALGSGLAVAIGGAVTAVAPFVAAGAGVVAVIVGIGSAIAKAIEWWDGLSGAQKEFVRENQPIQAAIGDTIDRIRELGQWVGANIPIWVGWARDAGGAVLEFAATVGDAISLAIEAANALIVVWQNRGEILRGVWNDLVNGAQELGSRIASAVGEMAQAVIAWFQNLAAESLNAMTTWRNDALNKVTQMMGDFDIVGRGLDLLKKGYSATFGFAADIVGKVQGKIEQFSASASSKFQAVVNSVKPLKDTLSDIWELAKKLPESLKGITGFLPSFGSGGGNPLEDLKSILSGGIPATTPGSANVVTPFGGRVTSLATTTPHHSYQRTGTGLARDVTLLQGDSTRVPVPSAISGRVTAAGQMGGYGNAVIVKSLEGFEVLMGHFERLSVRAGQMVQFGQSLGIQGSTGRSSGPHVHIEAPDKILDRWLRFISGTGKFAIGQRGKGGGDPHDHDHDHGDHGGHEGHNHAEHADHAGHNHDHGGDFRKFDYGDHEPLKNHGAHDHPIFGQGGGDSDDVKDIKKDEKKIEAAERIEQIMASVQEQIKKNQIAEKEASTNVILGLQSELEAQQVVLDAKRQNAGIADDYIMQLKQLAGTTKTDSIRVQAADLIEIIRALQAEIFEGESKLADFALDSIAENVETVQKRIANARAEYQNDYLLGLLAEEEAAAKAYETQAELADELLASIPAVEAFMAAASSPEAVLNAKALLEQIKFISAEAQHQQREVKKANEAAEKAENIGTKLNEKLIGLGKTAKDGFIDVLVEGGKGIGALFEDIGKQILKLGLNLLLNQVTKGLGGGGGGIASIFGFNGGGEVPNFSGGGMVGMLAGIGRALAREGPNAVLGALTPGEEVLRIDNGDAPFARDLMASGQWSQLKRMSGYSLGGTVANSGSGKTRGAPASIAQPAGIKVTSIERLGDFVSLDQVLQLFDARDPQVALAGAGIVESNFQSTNYRKKYGLG